MSKWMPLARERLNRGSYPVSPTVVNPKTDEVVRIEKISDEKLTALAERAKNLGGEEGLNLMRKIQFVRNTA